MSSGVYYIKNKINNKMYIGSSINLKTRMSHHFGDLKRNVHINKNLQNDYNTYGRDVFVVKIIEYLDGYDREFIYQREQYWLDYYMANIEVYNIYEEVICGRGYKHTIESKEKMSKAHKGSVVSEETKKKMAKASTGRTHKVSDEGKEKIRQANLGRKHTKESLKKISEASKNRVKSTEEREKLRQENQGEKNPQAKLTEDDVRKIRLLAEQKVPRLEIAKMFNIHKDYVGLIINRKRWKHIS